MASEESTPSFNRQISKPQISKPLISKRQKFWERLWASTILIYTFVATFVVWKTLKKYGVNPIAFFFIDAATSWTYGITSARMVMQIIHGNMKSARNWAFGAAASFITPQLYILITAHHAPADVYRIIIGVISALFLFTAISLFLEIKRKKRGTIHSL